MLLVVSAQPQKPYFLTTLVKGHLSVIVDNVFSTSLQTHHQLYKNQNGETLLNLPNLAQQRLQRRGCWQSSNIGSETMKLKLLSNPKLSRLVQPLHFFPRGVEKLVMPAMRLPTGLMTRFKTLVDVHKPVISDDLIKHYCQLDKPTTYVHLRKPCTSICLCGQPLNSFPETRKHIIDKGCSYLLYWVRPEF